MTDGSERLPPQSQEAERSVLGSMLRDNRVIADVVPIVRADDFYSYANQKVFQATIALYDKGQPVDAVVLAEKLKELKQIEDVGGYAYLGRLWDAVPTAANAEYYARIVRDKAIVRSLIHSCTEIQRDAFDHAMPADDLLDAAEQKILSIRIAGSGDSTTCLKDMIRRAEERIDQRQQNKRKVTGLSTGFVDLNTQTGGLQDSELVIVGARPSVGKSAFVLDMVRRALIEEDAAVFFASLEMSEGELTDRLICCRARVDLRKLRKGELNETEIDSVIEANQVLRPCKLYVDDASDQNMLRIAASARRHKLKHGIRLVVVDYLQLIEPDNLRESRHLQVGGTSRRLKRLARELKIPVVALSQLNRISEDRQGHSPRLSELRESGSLEQDADTVLLLHRPEMHDANERRGQMDVLIEKQRHGAIGKVTLLFKKEHQRFENYAPSDF